MMLWALTVLAAFGAAPFAREMLRKPMNAKERRSAPGAFAMLSTGLTHYQWTGPEGGPVVLCIHGLTTPSFVWQSIAAALGKVGFRVLTYDLFGRGYSDRPAGVQDSAFFLRQINDLLEDQGVGGKLNIIGYSMGGAIAAAFAAQHSDRVRQLVLLAPAGMHSASAGFLGGLAGIPLLGRWLMLLAYPALLRRGIRAEANLPKSVPDISKKQLAELDYRGFLPAVHSSLRNTLTDTLQTEHQQLRRARIPVVAVWAANDEIIPIACKDTLSDWNPEAVQHVISGAGHGVTYTHTKEVLKHVTSAFADHA